MADACVKSQGRLVATLLAGSWRQSPTTFECSAVEIEEIAPMLLSSGASALCWRRINHSNLRTTKAAEKFHQAYRANILQAAIHQRTIEQVSALLRSKGIEPILVKGWAVARLYPEQGLRPYEDIDLCVRPEQFAKAENALKDFPDQYKVDLHCGFEKFGGGNVEEIYARSQLVRIGQTDVRVLCAEDHLRILSIHMLREGAWRPMWLCDVAAAVELRPDDFEWNLCLDRNRRWSNWVICALRLAQELLGADIRGTPAAEKKKPLPGWLVPTILKEWESLQPSMMQRHRAPMASYWSRPASILAGFRHRWPNPIEATIIVRGRFNELPRLPFQIGSYLVRSAKFASRLTKSNRQ